MTCGQNVLMLRQVLHLTRSDLGKMLNVSARTVSEWEKDIYEPDLSSARIMASLLNISTDAFLGVKAPQSAVTTYNNSFPMLPMIGVCSKCGYAVYKNNLGQKSPILCTKCAREAAERRKAYNEECRLKCKKHLRNSLIIGIIVIIISIIVGIYVATSSPQDALLKQAALFFLCLVVGIFAFTFIGNLFLSEKMRDLLLRFTFGFDACSFGEESIFLLPFTLVFDLLGLLFGIVMFILGVLVVDIISPFVYPFSLKTAIKEIKQ